MQRSDESNFVFELFIGNPTVGKISFNGKEFTPASLPQGRRKRGAWGGGLSPPIISICIRQSKTIRLEKCEPNSDLLKKMRKSRLALSTVLAICYKLFLTRFLVQSRSTRSQTSNF